MVGLGDTVAKRNTRAGVESLDRVLDLVALRSRAGRARRLQCHGRRRCRDSRIARSMASPGEKSSRLKGWLISSTTSRCPWPSERGWRARARRRSQKVPRPLLQSAKVCGTRAGLRLFAIVVSLQDLASVTRRCAPRPIQAPFQGRNPAYEDRPRATRTARR